MGFFGKDKITLDQLAEDLATIVFHSISDDSLVPYKMLLKDIGENEMIDERQKREILILEILATTRAVQRIFTNPSEAKNLLDNLYSKVYNKISKIEAEQLKFEEFIHERYKVYYEILSSKDDNVLFRLGKQFTSYFLSKEDVSTGLVLIVSSSEFFAVSVENTGDFLKETLSKFELKK